jgi:hypothetical protein
MSRSRQQEELKKQWNERKHCLMKHGSLLMLKQIQQSRSAKKASEEDITTHSTCSNDGDELHL